MIDETLIAGDSPVERWVRPSAWKSTDGIKCITDKELEAWIQAGDGQIMDDYTVPLYNQTSLDAAVAAERAKCAVWLEMEGRNDLAYGIRRAMHCGPNPSLGPTTSA